MDELPEEASPTHTEEDDFAGDAKPSTTATSATNTTTTSSSSSSSADSKSSDEPEQNEAEIIEAMKQKMKQMQEEQERLEKIQQELQEEMGAPKSDSKEELDARSIFVGNVDYGSTPEELKAHFQPCGMINRVTIACNSYSGQPKGYAYIEFADEESVSNAMLLNETLFRGRQLKVTPKRTNIPGLAARGAGRPTRPSRRPSYGAYPRRPRRPYFYQPY